MVMNVVMPDTISVRMEVWFSFRWKIFFAKFFHNQLPFFLFRKVCEQGLPEPPSKRAFY